MALQAMVTRQFDARDPVVVTIARIDGGTTHNVIPDFARLKGTIRTLSADHHHLVINPAHVAISAQHRYTGAFNHSATRQRQSIHLGEEICKALAVDFVPRAPQDLIPRQAKQPFTGRIDTAEAPGCAIPQGHRHGEEFQQAVEVASGLPEFFQAAGSGIRFGSPATHVDIHQGEDPAGIQAFRINRTGSRGYPDWLATTPVQVELEIALAAFQVTAVLQQRGHQQSIGRVRKGLPAPSQFSGFTPEEDFHGCVCPHKTLITHQQQANWGTAENEIDIDLGVRATIARRCVSDGPSRLESVAVGHVHLGYAVWRGLNRPGRPHGQAGKAKHTAPGVASPRHLRRVTGRRKAGGRPATSGQAQSLALRRN